MCTAIGLQIAKNVEDTLVRTFVGPADTGIYSKSVQQTLYKMGESVLEAEPSITAVSGCEQSKLFIFMLYVAFCGLRF